MIARMGFAVLTGLASGAQAQDVPIVENGGFELLQPGAASLPAAWKADRAESGYALTGRDVHDGARALEIGFDKNVATAGYAGTIQGIALTGLSGRTLFVTGWLRRSNVESTAGLWLAFFDADGKRMDYVNDYDTPWPTPSAWSSRMIEAKIPPGTVRMLVGASISGQSGKLLVDSIAMGLRAP